MKMGQVCVYKIRQFLCVRNTNLTKLSKFPVSLTDNCCERAATLTGFLWRVGPGNSLQPVLISISGRASEIVCSCEHFYSTLVSGSESIMRSIDRMDRMLCSVLKWELPFVMVNFIWFCGESTLN